jgi:hypothetical protein
MARVYSGLSSYKPVVGSYLAAAGLYARLAEAARRRLGRLWLTFTSDLRDSEDRWSQQRISGHMPGSLFDPRYKGLTADAAGIDAAIMCRRDHLRNHPWCVKDEALSAHPRTRS